VWQRAELSLPSNTDDIFLPSRGFHALGTLQVVEAADRDDIGVEVIVGHHEDSDLLQRSNVCTLRRGENGHGVGIFVSSLQIRVSGLCEFMYWPIDTADQTPPPRTRRVIL
jgi:hypothetical protein